MNRLLIIDGHNLLFQMFYGMPSRIVNKNGKAIQGTLGFVGALLKIIKSTEPTHIIALFDSEHENERAGINPEYKANRPDFSQIPEEETPFSQLPDIYAALDYMGIKRFETICCEADDLIASYVFSYRQDIDHVIVSFDSDIFQLISDNTVVLRYRGDKSIVCNCNYIMARYGIEPQQYADFKSLVGDSADNIKGANKIGIKTASQLLRQFGTLEAVIDNVELIQKKSIRESIINSTSLLKMNQQIITLDNRYKVPICLEELKYHYDGITMNEVLVGIGLR